MNTDSLTPAKPQIEISIILPVFNVGPFITECLNSLIEQDFKHHYEAILVNDASTDNSAEVCRSFASSHPEIFTFIDSRENQGVSVSRNIGLDHAKGQFFMFVDPDDALPNQALSTLFECAQKFQADIVKGNNSIFNRHGEKPARYSATQDQLISKEDILTVFFNHDLVRGHPWGKLFRTHTLGDMRFTPGVRMAQDLLYCSEVFSKAKSLVLTPNTVYRYRNRDTGTTGKKYETGAYLHWLDSVEKTGLFSRSSDHHKAHKRLQVRTLNQLSRECRKLSPEVIVKVLKELEYRAQKWDIRLSQLLIIDRLGFKTFTRYLKMQSAIRKARKHIRTTIN